MLEEDCDVTNAEMEQEKMDEGERTGKVYEGPNTQGLTSSSMTLVADSHNGIPQNTDQQTPRHKRGRPRKNPDIKKQQSLTEELSIVNVSLTDTSQQPHKDPERTLAYGNSYDQRLDGTADQEQRITVSTVQEKYAFSSSFTSANEQPTSDSTETAVLIQNNCLLSDMMHHVPVSDIEGQYELTLEEKLNKDCHPEGEEQCTAPSLSNMNDLFLKEKAKTGSSTPYLHPTVVSEKSWTTLSKREAKDKQDIQSSESALVRMPVRAFSVDPKFSEVSKTNLLKNQEQLTLETLEETVKEESITGCFLPDKLKRLDPTFTMLKPEDGKLFQPVENVIKEQVSRVMSPEPEVKVRRKVGRPPKRKRIAKAQVLQKVDPSHQLDSVEFFQENSNIDIIDKPLEIIKMDATANSKLSKRVTNFDASQNQISKIFAPVEDSKQIISCKIKPQKKVGRPRKKSINALVGTTRAAGHNGCNDPVKESINNSPKRLFTRKILGKVGICTGEHIKSGKERHTRKSPLETSSQEQPVKKLSEKSAIHKANLHTLVRNPGRIQDVPSDMQLVGKKIKESAQDLWDLKQTNGPLFQNPQKRGRQKSTLTETKKGRKMVRELTSSKNFLDQQIQSAAKHDSKIVHVNKSKQFSHQGRESKDIKIQDETDTVVSPQHCQMVKKSTALIQETQSNVKMTLKTVKDNTLCDELGKVGEVLAGFKATGNTTKVKRRIGRPLKKKTLIKMARQLVMMQEERANETSLLRHPETQKIYNIPSCHPRKNKGKKEKKKPLWLPDLPLTNLRRYTRACKVVTDYTAEKQESHLEHSTDKSALPSFSAYPDPFLIAGIKNDISPKKSSKLGKMFTTKAKSEQLTKRKILEKTRKVPILDIKAEESDQPGLSDFCLDNPIALQDSQPLVSKETVSDSILSSGENLLNNGDKQKKPRKIKPVPVKMESELQAGTDSFSEMYNTTSPTIPQNKITTLKHKPKCIPCSPGKIVKGVTSAMFERTDSVLNMKGQGKSEMPQKKVCVHTPQPSACKMSQLHEVDKPSIYLLSSQDTAKFNISPVKVPRKRGRPRKDHTESVKKEIDSGHLLADQTPLSQVYYSKSSEIAVSGLNISTKLNPKKPHKVDRRRKRFRNQKTLRELEGTLDNSFKAVTEIVETEVHNIPQKNSKKLKVESVLRPSSEEAKSNQNTCQLCQVETGLMSLVQKHMELNSTDEFTKQPRKVVGSRKKRRRKRSWWDDRGKIKCEPVEKDAELVLKSNEDKRATETLKENVTDEKMPAKTPDESVSMNQPGLQMAAELLPETLHVNEESTSDREILAVSKSSERRTIIKALQQIDGEVSLENKDIQKNSIENQNESATNGGKQNCSGKDMEKLLKVVAPELCKKTKDKLLGNEIPQDNNSSDSHSETETPEFLSSKTIGYEEEMEVSHAIIRVPVENSENTKKRDDQTPFQEIELRERGVVKLTSTKAIQDDSSDTHHLTSTESKIQIPIDSKSLEAVHGNNASHVDMFSNPPDEKARREDLSSQNEFSKTFQYENTGEVYISRTEQNDQVLNENESKENKSENDSAENPMEKVSLTSGSSTPRGPGRPPKCQGKKPIECHYCGRSFHYISSYIIHRRIHTGERPYNCQECGRTFTQHSNLKTHRKIHKMSESLQCPYCDSRFTDRDKLFEHCKMHTEDLTKTSFIEKLGQESKSVATPPKSNTPCSTITLKDGKPHVCEVCGKRFRFTSMLKIHLRVHSGEKPYTCKVCGKAFSQACSVRVHEKIHWSVKPYICTLCGKGFAQLGTLKTHRCRPIGENHVQKVEKVKSPVTFQCHICKKRFGLRHQYNLHMRTHSNVQCYTCDVCSQKVSDLNIHRQSCVKLSGDQEIVKDGGSNSPACQISEESQCQYNQQFQPQPQLCSNLKSYQYYQLQSPQPQHEDYQQTQNKMSSYPQAQSYNPSHMKRGKHSLQSYPKHTNSSTPQIQIFNLEYLRQCHFPRPGSFQSQCVDHKSNPRKYLCPRCGRLFRHLGRLRAHMLTHVRGHSYICECCGKNLENWNKLWLHQRVHRQKRGRFFCPKCGQGFRFVGLYKQHLEEHTEQKPYVCPPCPYTFSTEERLKAHQRECHYSYKSCKCNICGKGFVHHRNLERHIFIHHHAFSCYCSVCSLSFSDPTELEIHRKTHTTPNIPVPALSSQPVLLPYQCGECDACFKTLNLLFHHQICHSSSKKKAWRSGEIVGQQHQQQLGYKCKRTPAPFVNPEISSLNTLQNRSQNFCACTGSTSVPTIPPCSTNKVCQQVDCHISPSFPLTYLKPPHFYRFSQRGGNKLANPPDIHTLIDDASLPQTLHQTPTAVPSSEPQTQHLHFHTQTGKSISLYPQRTQQISQTQTNTGPQNEEMLHVQKPIHSYRKSPIITNRVSSSSIEENEEDVDDGFDCAECGAQFDDVPGLYEHYIQHARGEV